MLQTSGNNVRGFTWWGDTAGFYTYLAPNSSQPDVIYSIAMCDSTGDNPPCTQYSPPGLPSMYGARSRHAGGVGASFCDGSATFVNDTININVWRALSTTHGGETISGSSY